MYNQSINDFEARQFSIATAIAIPGILKSHSIILHADYVDNLDEGDVEPGQTLYTFPNALRVPRGYVGSTLFSQANRLSANYHLPIWYPDLGFAGIIYFQRLRLNTFIDWSELQFQNGTIRTWSAGVEVVTDAKVFNTEPVTFGLRWTYSNLTKNYTTEFITPLYRF